jgi:hypothetical protein
LNKRERVAVGYCLVNKTRRRRVAGWALEMPGLTNWWRDLKVRQRRLKVILSNI